MISSKSNRSPNRGRPVQIAGVHARDGEAADDPVAFGDHVLCRHRELVVRPPQHRRGVLEALGSGSLGGIPRVVNDVGMHDLVDDVQAARADRVLLEAAEGL